MKQTLRIILISALATAAVLKGVPALAEAPKADLNVSVVRTGDLQLTTDAGQRELDRRLVVAAREVCGGASDVDLAGKNDVRQCRHAVLAEARAKSADLVAGRTSERTITVAAR